MQCQSLHLQIVGSIDCPCECKWRRLHLLQVFSILSRIQLIKLNQREHVYGGDGIVVYVM